MLDEDHDQKMLDESRKQVELLEKHIVDVEQHLKLKRNALSFWTRRRSKYAARLLLNRNRKQRGD